jgi:hypothetical protein
MMQGKIYRTAMVSIHAAQPEHVSKMVVSFLDAVECAQRE